MANMMLECGAVKVSVDQPFKLTSGKLSPVYFDCRRLISYPGAMTLITGLFQWYLDQENASIDIIAGGESAGIPFATRLSAAAGIPMVYVRKKSKSHGTSSSIEGSARTGSEALLVEDLITDGGSKMVFIHGLRNAGLNVHKCLVVLDREQGGAQILQEQGVILHALITAEKVLVSGLHSGVLKESDAQTALNFIRNA